MRFSDPELLKSSCQSSLFTAHLGVGCVMHRCVALLTLGSEKRLWRSHLPLFLCCKLCLCVILSHWKREKVHHSTHLWFLKISKSCWSGFEAWRQDCVWWERGLRCLIRPSGQGPDGYVLYRHQSCEMYVIAYLGTFINSGFWFLCFVLFLFIYLFIYCILFVCVSRTG